MKALLEKAHEHDDNPNPRAVKTWSVPSVTRTIYRGATWLTWSIGAEVWRDWHSWGVNINLGPFYLSFVSEEPPPPPTPPQPTVFRATRVS